MGWGNVQPLKGPASVLDGQRESETLSRQPAGCRRYATSEPEWGWVRIGYTNEEHE
jgi:hypothetical protein